jgi:hypothetical protein
MSSFHYIASEKQEFEVEAMGDHEYLVRVHGADEDAEAWMRVTPELLADLGIAETDEPALVRRTIAFLLLHQEASDFPAIVEIEDVLAGYPDFRTALAG